MNKKITILILESKIYSASAIDLYKSIGEVFLYENLKKQEKGKIKKKAEVLIVMLGHKLDKKLIDTMPNLKIIATQTTGLNHIDVNYLKYKRIKLISLRGQTSFMKNIPSTAEEAFGLMLALSRNLPWAFEDVKEGNWNRGKWFGYQMLGKTLGILGFGRLGTIMAKYGNAFGMKVIACDPNVPKKIMASKKVEKVTIGKLFERSDILSVHVLLTDKTHNLIKEENIKKMKKDAYIINTARAEIFEKGLLYKALKNQWIKGAAIDIMLDEKKDGSHLKTDPLWHYAKKNKNLIIVPHIGGATREAMSITQEFLASLVKKSFRK